MALQTIVDRPVRVYQPFKNAKNYIAYIDGFSVRFTASTPMAAEKQARAWARKQYEDATTPAQRREHERRKAERLEQEKAASAVADDPSGAAA